MAYLQGVEPDEATGLVRERYDADRAQLGYVAGYTKLLSLHPEVQVAWLGLIGAIRGSMRLRRYELATLAAATAMRCSYCILAHGQVLAKNFFTPEEVVTLVEDPAAAGLSDEELAVMHLARKVATAAHEVSEADVDALRGFGLTDREILDVVLVASARAFFSKTLDALAAEPDHAAVETLGADVATRIALGRPLGPGTLAGG